MYDGVSMRGDVVSFAHHVVVIAATVLVPSREYKLHVPQHESKDVEGPSVR